MIDLDLASINAVEDRKTMFVKEWFASMKVLDQTRRQFMPAKQDAGQGTKKEPGQKPVPQHEEDSRKPGQQRDDDGMKWHKEHERPVGGKQGR